LIAIPGKLPPFAFTFTELEPFTSAGQTVFLAFLHPGVRHEQAVLLQLAAQLQVELAERARDAEAQCASLAVHPAPGHRRQDVELLAGLGELQRTPDLHAQRIGREVVLELSVVDGDGHNEGAKEHAGCGSFASTCGVVFDAGQNHATSIFLGCWAE